MSLIQKHIHLLESELKQYILNEHQLTAIKIQQIELELQVCEICSEKYIALLDNVNLPIKSEVTNGHVEQILCDIDKLESTVVTLKTKKKWYENSVLHVVAAASITGILFVSGFLSVIANDTVNQQTPVAHEEKEENENKKIKWLDLSEQEWVKSLQVEMLKIKNIQLFKEE